MTMLKKLLTFVFLLSFLFQHISFASDDLTNQIKVLKKLNDDGVLTDQEFSDAKAILIEKAEQKEEESTETKLAALPKETEKEEINA